MWRILRNRLLPLVAAGLGACSEAGTLGVPTNPVVSTAGEASRSAVPEESYLSLLVPGATGTFALGINANGVIVGRYSVGSAVHAFVRTPEGEFRTIDHPGASFSTAFDVNGDGYIVGAYSLPGAPSVRHAFVRSPDGVYTTFDPPGSTFTNPLGINERGDIVGRYCTRTTCRRPGEGDYRGFLRTADGRITTFDVPGSDETNAWKIAPGGRIVGAYRDLLGRSRIFVGERGAFETVDLPGSRVVSQDNGGTNPRGDLVGVYCARSPCHVAPTGSRGFLLSGGRFQTVDVPGAVSTAPLDINPRGDIVGGYYDTRGRPRGFLRRSRAR